MSIPKSPEARTAELSSHETPALMKVLRNLTITIPGTETSVVLTGLKPYTIAENLGWLYAPMLGMQPCDFYARYNPFRGMSHSLIVAREGEQVGACVRVMKASRIDLETGKPVPMPNEGDIVTYLGLRRNEIGRLMFLDKTDTLYLVPTGRIVDKVAVVRDRRSITQDADMELGRLLP